MAIEVAWLKRKKSLVGRRKTDLTLAGLHMEGLGRQKPRASCLKVPDTTLPQSLIFTSIFQSDCAWCCPSATSSAPAGKYEEAPTAIVEVKGTGAANAASS
jgi:hypothetical protein